jgi:hypothetical protein
MKIRSTFTVLFVFAFSLFIHAQNVGIGTTSPVSKLDVNGDLSLREGSAITVSAGSNTITLPSVKNSVYRLTGATGAFSITSISAGNDGSVLNLINATGQTMTLTNGSSILTNTGADLVAVSSATSVTLIYNATISQWVVTASQGFNTGIAGAAGPTGPTGAAGSTGSVGPAGPTGATGATGSGGSVGPAGPTGAAGAAGGAGAVGPAGPAGAAGGAGAVGPAGPAGAAGAAGAAGPSGAAGPTGTSLSGSGTVNILPKFVTNTTTLGNSAVTDNGTNVNISYLNNGVAPRPLITDESGNIITVAPSYFSAGSSINTASGSFTVPAGVYQIYVLIIGGGGGSDADANFADGGNGGEVMGIIDVTPGEVLPFVVGTGGAYIYSTNYSAGGNGSSISRGSTLLAAGGGGGGGNGNNAYSGYGGGVTFGTSINGAAATGASAAGGAGGNNYIGYLRTPVSYVGYSNINIIAEDYGYNSYASNPGGYTIDPAPYGYIAISPYSSFEAKLGTTASYGVGGISTTPTNGVAGVVAIFY